MTPKVDNSYRELAFYRIATMTETPFMTEDLTAEADQTAVTNTAADIAARFGIEDFAGIAQRLEKRIPRNEPAGPWKHSPTALFSRPALAHSQPSCSTWLPGSDRTFL